MPLRWNYLAITFLHRVQKAVRLELAKVRKFHKIVIKHETFQRIKNQEMFIAAIQLSRIVNSLVAITRIYMKIPDNGKLTSSKDKLEIMMIYGSMVYEAVLEFGRLSKVLKVLASWKSRHIDIDYINKEKGDKNSLLMTVLHSVRNEIMFHFDKHAITEAISRSDTTGDVLFAYGETPELYDVVYGIVDNLILRHFAMKEGSTRGLETIYQEYIDYVGSMNTRIIDIADEMLKEILASVSTKSKSPLFDNAGKMRGV